ncbi:hypothetical protein FA014_01855 [Cellulomonas hominis]|uniref:Uncharacterized protein n=1 Tax=Cellulomonas hominis TaxID=156981 RepID=A0A7Z8K2G7_9CELL|nr:hypothetical protein [Cellulomonas hominis]TKR27126.1 hypothetical protein FA014_01855 [Cellulomonas hominis]
MDGSSADALTDAIASLLTGTGGGLLGVVIGAAVQRRRNRAEADLARARAEQLLTDSTLAGHQSASDALAQAIRVQTEHLLQPLRSEIARQGEQIARQDEQIARLRAESERLRAERTAWRGRYWRAIDHIRALIAWHAAGAQGPRPRPHRDIATDI